MIRPATLRDPPCNPKQAYLALEEQAADAGAALAIGSSPKALRFP